MRRRSALAVRPYGERLRPKVFGFLSALGVDVVAPAELSDTASNEQVYEHLAQHPCDVLVVPFHVVRTPDGKRTNGLELLAGLREKVPWAREVPVVMPVSLFATVAFDAAWRTANAARVFPLLEGEIDSNATRLSFQRFMEDAAARPATP